MKQQSLAAATGTLTAAPKFELPEVFQGPQEKVVGRALAPYITFAHKGRPDEYTKLVGKFGGIDEGDMYLIEGDVLTKLPTVKVSPMRIKQYWIEKNPAGEMMKSSYTEMPWPWAESIDAVVLVYLDDRVVVANIQPHTTKCSGFKVLADALDECQKPEWADKSPAHKETLQINQPFMRFFGEMRVAPPRISKRSGLPYRITQCSIKPVTNVEVKLLKAFVESDHKKSMEDAAARFSLRLKEIEEKLIKR